MSDKYLVNDDQLEEVAGGWGTSFVYCQVGNWYFSNNEPKYRGLYGKMIQSDNSKPRNALAHTLQFYRLENNTLTNTGNTKEYSDLDLQYYKYEAADVSGYIIVG